MKDRNKIMRFFGLHPQNDVRRKFAFTLAEGATHVGNSNNKRRFAFTLAEVLVTLGIIGVVAVLTVPNVISSYQKKLYVTQLQKGYAQLQQAFSLAMANDEVDDMRDTTLIGTIPDCISTGHDIESFVFELKKYMKISRYCAPTNDPENDPCFSAEYKNFLGVTPDSEFRRHGRLKIFTPSGITYSFFGLCGQSDYGLFAGSVEIDVNGDKKPNRLGYDLFPVALQLNGDLIFPGSQLWDDLYGHPWDEERSWACLNLQDRKDSFWIGEYCGGRIFDNGWVMDY